ncbi:hypothetical protein AYK25_09930 [Thermoplasmatales archaeon SM1-50]|nr:MAG: hypothetical protein AYK25_09930 [Thermoplasmatales archaeon SM1-50]
MKKNIVGICVCMLVLATVGSAVGTINESVDVKTTNFTHINAPIRAMIPSFFQGDCVVWDNYVEWARVAYHAQDDPPESSPNWNSFPADDFQFDEETDVYWVYWYMCYWNCNPAGGPKDYHYDWNITFYEDDGTGYRPGALYAGPFTIPDADIIKGEALGNSSNISNGWWACGMGAVFSEPVTFQPDTKYWISIYSTGPHYPQSGWYARNDTYYPIRLHEAIFTSDVWGYPEWTNLSEIWGSPLDMLFLLGGELLPFEVTLSKGMGVTATIKNLLPEPYNQTNITVTFTVTGGVVLNPTKSFFIEKLNVSATETIKFYPIGFGSITIEARAIAMSAAAGWGNTSGFLILFFIL